MAIGKKGIYKETSSLPTNISESMTAVFERLCKGEEQNMDEIILALYLRPLGNFERTMWYWEIPPISGIYQCDDMQFPAHYVPLDDSAC